MTPVLYTTTTKGEMDPALYTAATKGDVQVLKSYKNTLLDVVTFPAKNTVLHVIAQYSASSDAIKEISDLHPSLLGSLLIWTNAEDETALYIATRNRCQGIVRELLKASERAVSPDLEAGGGDVSLTQRMVRISNKKEDTPLHEAVNNKDIEIVNLLVNGDPQYQHLPNKMGKTPLYIALEKRLSRDNEDLYFQDRIEIFFQLSSNFPSSSYDPTLEAILSVCTKPGFQGPHGETVLHAAARRKTTSQWIDKICDRVPNIKKTQDEQGFTALHYAAYFNNDRGAELLLKDDKFMAYISADKEKHESVTPLHIAATRGNEGVMVSILKLCEDCWSGVTSKGQNILHLAAKGQHRETIIFIMKQPWAINLMNMKDNDGNTPSHLLLSSIPKDYKSIKPLLEHTNVYLDSYNDHQYTPYEMLDKSEIKFSAKKINILKKLRTKFLNVEKSPWTINNHMYKNSEKEISDKAQRLEDMRRRADTQLVVAALVATVTFAAGFTLPGGYDGNVGPNQGMPVLFNKVVFKAFITMDTIAFISSCIAIYLHFTATLYEHDEEKISNRYATALMFLAIAMITMALTFLTGIYVVLEESPTIIWVISVWGIIFLLYLITKVYRDMGIYVEEYLLLGLSDVLASFVLVLTIPIRLFIVLIMYLGLLLGFQRHYPFLLRVFLWLI